MYLQGTLNNTTTPALSMTRMKHTMNMKAYEQSNHLGNVVVTVSDARQVLNSGASVTGYMAIVKSASDYSSFGVTKAGRTYTSTSYRYTFNGKEKENEIASGDLDFGARIYDARLGRWLSLDPSMRKYASHSPYNFVLNSPTGLIDADGMDPCQERVIGLSEMIKLLNDNKINDLVALRDYFGTGYGGSATGDAITGRYLYSPKWGWLDMKHFSAAAARADQVTWSEEETLREGERLEYRQENGIWPNNGPNSKNSAWDPEDLVSNLIGVGFERYLETDAADGKSFTQNLTEYLSDLGFVDAPTSAPSYNEIPKTQHEETGKSNYTYYPMWAPDAGKRTSDTDKALLEFLGNYLEEYGDTQDRRAYEESQGF